MPTFKYTSANTNGSGPALIEAPDRGAAVRSLLAKGITPVSVEVVGDQRPAPGASDQRPPATQGEGALVVRPSSQEVGPHAQRRGRTMSLGETASFIRELATAIQAGLPMVPALRTLGKSGRSPAQRAMLNHLTEHVEQGKTLNAAMAAWGPPFGELVINLTKAGESSGRLGETLHQAADLLERELGLRRAVMAATLYPAILGVLVSLAVVVMTTIIVPRVLAPLKGQLKNLPIPTKIVQGFAEVVGTWWWAVFLVAGLGLIAFVRARQQEGPRLAMDRAMLRVPLFGPVLRDAAVARFTRTLGTLVSAGLPVLQALRLTGQTMTNRAMRSAIMHVCDQVAAGKTIAEPLERAGIFPPLLVQIVSLGERSGKLPELLNQAAGSLDSRTETRVKVLTSVLPPVLIVVLAMVVGFVVAAIILPLLEMQEAIG